MNINIRGGQFWDEEFLIWQEEEAAKRSTAFLFSYFISIHMETILSNRIFLKCRRSITLFHISNLYTNYTFRPSFPRSIQEKVSYNYHFMFTFHIYTYWDQPIHYQFKNKRHYFSFVSHTNTNWDNFRPEWGCDDYLWERLASRHQLIRLICNLNTLGSLEISVSLQEYLGFFRII